MNFSRLNNNREGLAVFLFAAAFTAAFIFWPKESFSHSTKVVEGKSVIGNGTGDVQLSAKLSQKKLVQNENGEVYVEVTVKAPQVEGKKIVNPSTDVVVVLDRSGSMSSSDKLPLAKQAIVALIDRLDSDDKFGLVTFDNNAQIWSGLQYMTANNKERISQIVRGIHVGGSTNMADGMEKAISLLANSRTGRSQRIMLLSDGQANVGVRDPMGLAAIASRASSKGSVLSSIGMGLGFNEHVMAAIADHGMGNYSFLEHLAGLGEILSKDLDDARAIYAKSSTLEISPGKGVSIVDVGGLPLNFSGNTYSIPVGQILAGAERKFFVTAKLPTASKGQFNIGSMELSYISDYGNDSVKIDDNALQVAVLAPEKREEVIASINQPVLKRSWLKNNLGRMQKDVASKLASGDKEGAARAREVYQQKVAAQSELLGMAPEEEKRLNEELSELKDAEEDAFTGSLSAQKHKQNVYGKGYLLKSRATAGTSKGSLNQTSK